MKKFIVFISLFVCLFIGFTLSQYYYFVDGENSPYQQGCWESLYVYVNTSGQAINGGEITLKIDGNAHYLYTGDDSEKLGLKLFSGIDTLSNGAFADWPRDGSYNPTSPSWSESFPYLKIARTNGTAPDFNGDRKFGYLYFKPSYNNNSYQLVYEISNLKLSDTLGNNKISQGTHPVQRYIQIQKAPCTQDEQLPQITNLTQGKTISSSSTTKVKNTSSMTLRLKDDQDVGKKTGTGEIPYIYNVNNEWTGNSNQSITNQYGVNPDMFELKVMGKDNNGNDQSKILTCFSDGVDCDETSGITRENNDMNYKVVISTGALFDYGVEHEITVKGTVCDRTGEYKNSPISGNCLTTFERHFNKPVAPTVLFTYPNSSKNTFINLDEDIVMYLDDDWAGVSGDSIIVTLSGIDNDYFGIFSGDNLQKIPAVSLSGANTSGYDVTVLGTVHEKFPTSGTIEITVNFEDNEGKAVSSNANTFEFTTRPPCSELGGCCNKMNIEIVTGTFNNYYFVPYGQMTGLTISGSAEFSAEWTGSDEEGWIGTGTLTCQTQGLSIYSGDSSDPHFVYFTDGDSLVISGEDIVASFDPETNTLVLSKFVGNVGVSTVSPKIAAPIRDFEFEWTVLGSGVDENVSGYKVELYSGSSCDEGTPIWSGYVAGTGATGMQYTGDALTSLQQYCWKVSAMKGNRVLTGDTATFTGMMEMVVKVNLGRSNGNNYSLGQIAFYLSGNYDSPQHTGIVYLGRDGTGLYNVMLNSGYYDVVIKVWQHLASLLTGVQINANPITLDFGSGLGVSDNGYQREGDAGSVQDGSVDTIDFTYLYGTCIPSGKTEVDTIVTSNIRCDFNGSKTINSADSVQIVNNFDRSDKAIFNKYLGFSNADYIDYITEDLLNNY